MRKKLLTALFSTALFYSFIAQNGEQFKVVTPHADPSLRFTENLGQWDQRILFRAQLDGGALFLEKSCLSFNFYDKVKFRSIHHGALMREKDLKVDGHAYKVHFIGCNPDPHIEKDKEGSDYENFFIGNDQSKWKGNVRNYHQVWLKDLYMGIDYEVLTAVSGIKYNFHVKAGASPNVIKLRYEGTDKIRIRDGAIILKLSIGEIVEQKPFAYQVIDGKRVNIACRYTLDKNVIGFEFPEGYYRSYDLVIDPILVFAAQSGSTADNFGMSATYDAQGNLYAGGIVYGAGYPTTTGAYKSNYSGLVYYGNTDVVVTKYNATGTNLIYSSYIGGNFAETVHSMIVDNNNNLCIYGVTSSPDFPVTQGSYDQTFNGGQFLMFVSNGMRFVNGTDIYITKFNSAGTGLLASTFLGGSANDGVNHTDQYSNGFQVPATPPAQGNISVFEPDYDSLQWNYGDQCRGEIMVDALNNIYIASSTRSSNFPVVNAFDNSLGGRQDGIISKFNSNLNSLIYSSYIGGSSTDAGYGLIVKSNFEVYVTGGTSSSNFPWCAGGYQPTYQGGVADGWVIRVSATGTNVLNGTFFGTAAYDQSYFVQADKYNNIYIYGQSLGNTPVVMAPNENTIFSVPNTHQFIARFNQSLNSLNMCTKFGNFTNDVDISPSAFAVDKCNNIYLSGWGGKLWANSAPLSNMPLLQPTQAQTTGFDFYFMGLDSNAKALKYGSYFGGAISQEHVDGGTSRFDPGGRIYQSVCAGCGGHDDFPVTQGSWPGTPGNPNHAQNCNNGVIKLDFQLQLAVATINTNTLGGCSPLTVTFTNATPPGNPGATFMWYLGNNVTSSTIVNPSITYTVPGVYTVALVVRDNLTCNKKDSIISVITVYSKPSTTIAVQGAQCSNTIALSHSTTGTLAPNPFQWNFGDGGTSTLSAPVYTYANTGVYNITFSVTDANGCKEVKSQTVSVFNFTPTVVGGATICSGSTATLSAGGGTSYSWTPSGTLNNNLVASPLASPAVSTTYSVIISNNTPGYTCTKTQTTQVIVRPRPNSSFIQYASECTNTVQTQNTATGTLSSTSFSWNFGDGSPPVTEPAATHTYQANGLFTISLNVTDIFGCTHVSTKTVAIFNFTPGIVNSASLCFGQSASLKADGGTHYTWTPSQGLSGANIPSPSASPSVTTLYTVNIVSNTPFGFNCKSTLTTQVEVFPTPTANFNYTANPCGGGVSYFDLSAEDVSARSWTLAPQATSTLQNPYYFYKNGGSFVVSLLASNIHGCSDRHDEPITIGVPPPVSVNDPTLICIGNSAQLYADGGVSYQWTPDASLDFPAMANPKASPKVSTDYSVYITTSVTINGEACKFMLITRVDVSVLSSGPVTAYANPTLVTTGDPSTLIYVGDAGALVTWYPMNSTTPVIGYTVKAYPDRPTTYTAVAQRGACREEIPVHVDAYSEGCIDKDVFIPNTFTPNGDGENDVLYVRGLKVDEVYFAVYNRWGEPVFETREKERGWDGKYNDKEADVGVFGWYLKVRCINGEETFMKGNVTLIR